MIQDFQTIVHQLLNLISDEEPAALELINTPSSARLAGSPEFLRALNISFLVMLAGDEHSSYQQARSLLENYSQVSDLAQFYLSAQLAIQQEINSLEDSSPGAAQALSSVASQLKDSKSSKSSAEITKQLWSFTHPEAAGIWHHEQERIAALRDKRTVREIHENPSPLKNPAKQVLFTANALLTLPSGSKPLEKQALSPEIQDQIAPLMTEPQLYWYDHPIQVGVQHPNNEVLYGLKGLQDALDFEIEKSTCREGQQLTCLLSVSVTHDGLHAIARQYLAEALQEGDPLPGLKIVMLTESDSQRLITEILAPAARHYLGVEDAQAKLNVLGVDGEYGRHYSFLKAIAALWEVLVDPQIEATFKIDLDQVFPQEQLLQETGKTAFQHLQSSLWGAQGIDNHGHPVDLGMIAGALVNEGDIMDGLFTPDVPLPSTGHKLALDEHIFFSQLPQALSTQAEMMARYDTPQLNGVNNCLQRVHVTGGTNGILVKFLRRYRPFTPSFIGRAEDQAYILSTFETGKNRLAYLHQPGLIMRHDKQAFAQEAIQSAQVGKLIGDYVRILYFSAYSRRVGKDLSEIKDRLDPFTGSFISFVPTTLAILRFALKSEALFQAGESKLALDFLHLGSRRINKAIMFAYNQLADQYEQERQGWNLYYDTLLAIENGIEDGDPFAENLQHRTRELIDSCTVTVLGSA